MGSEVQEEQAPSEQPSPGDKEISILGHLQELRWRIIRSLVAIAIATGVAFFFADDIFTLLKTRVEGLDLVYIEVTELLSVYMRISLLGGIFLSLPYLIYEAVMFVTPALTGREKFYLFLLLPGIVIFFAGGAVFAYYILLPPALKFLIMPPFAEGLARPTIRIGNYVEVVSKLLFSIGLVFEMPIVIVFLTKIGIVTPNALARRRKYAVLLAFVLAAMITPTFDPVNQALVAAPIVVLYELGIWLSRVFVRQKASETPSEQPAA